MGTILHFLSARSTFRPFKVSGGCFLSLACALPAKNWDPRAGMCAGHHQRNSLFQFTKARHSLFAGHRFHSERVYAAMQIIRRNSHASGVEGKAFLGPLFGSSQGLPTASPIALPREPEDKTVDDHQAEEGRRKEKEDKPEKQSVKKGKPHKSPVVDTDINAVTKYMLGMAEKVLREGENITPTTKLTEFRTRDGRMWDGLDTIGFVEDVEELFDVIISDETMDNFETLQEIADLVVAQRQMREMTIRVLCKQ
ncbi:putative acyl carrier protein [Toxoplasma gondii TgCatPRC2]|uniref:Carrier domain-containing protein n=4 Tax=Toxoplasma gondii TaxID=5811 RepID=S8GGX1_TOXGM|nr:hypothetical protein TGME49_265538 [Toxoplasma gondii ME49]EPT27709.1 hypothetical protein TGME49_265538 [Toxoplasma gondii ME49]KYF45443.1 putative acyl carrier protein [Toxoplasma gondii ARI]KYK64702.1 putative acyl carrier protein [Toxoplasma gondii TgCatPRC2]PIM01964.1 putative acyl carrier protein [Toxoplasma gondii COUG]|eukprot:XP_002368683.2 hypothetical protein TGME49_265538 [Toxoplasma gondii ME49]